MRAKLLLLVTLLVPALVSARAYHALQPQPASQLRGSASLGGDTPVVVSLPFSTTGRIPDDANVVSHVIFDGAKLVPIIGPDWTQNGTVPQNVASPFYPSGFSGAQQKGSGPYSTLNYYSIPATNPLQFTGDYSCHAVVIPATFAAAPTIAANSNATPNLGWIAQFSGTGAARIWSNGVFTDTANSAVANAPAVVSWGRSGTSHFIKLNLGTTATAVTPITAAVANPATIGVFGGIGAPFTGTIVEVACSTTPFVEVTAGTVQQRVFGMLATSGASISVARAMTGTYTTPDGNLWTAPAGILRVGCEDTAVTKCGGLGEPTRTNLALQSEALDNVAWTTSGTCTVTANQGTIPGWTPGTLDKVQCTGAATDIRFQTVTVASSTGPFTFSSWVAADAGSKVESIRMGGLTGGATGCSCARSDGGVCTTATATTDGWAYGTFGTTPARLMLTCSSTAATVSVTPSVHDGQFTVTFNVGGIFGGAQFEVGSYATSYVPTTTVAVARNADGVTVANPATVQSALCGDGTFTPENGGSWIVLPSGDHWPWMIGTYGVTGGSGLSASSSGSIFAAGTNAPNSVFFSSVVTPFAAGTPHRIAAGFAVGAAPTLAFDGVSQTVLPGGSVPEVSPPSGTITLGASGAGANVGNFPGYIRNLKILRSVCR